eukprot:739807-Pleurochrysis_carterae.AAC.2
MGPEKRSKTRHDVLTAEVRVDGAKWRGAGIAGSVVVCDGSGKPGGWSMSASHGGSDSVVGRRRR